MTRWVAGAALCATVVVGCAYYNTLYNAKEMYADAEKQQAQQRTMAGGNEHVAFCEDRTAT